MTISFLLVAWILSWFSLEEIVIDAVKELFDKNISISSYYFIALMLGLLLDIALIIKTKII